MIKDGPRSGTMANQELKAMIVDLVFGGGLLIKRALLSLEGAACVADLFSAHDSAQAADGTSARDIRASGR